MKIQIRPEIENIRDEIIATRRDIHQYPERGFQEVRTAALVAERLRSYGLEVRTGVGRTGVVGILAGRLPGPTIALRADMDALPLQELNDVPYKSQTAGVMHACGHDGHVAVLLGVARVLAAARERLAGEVRFLFQPAEEGQGGARYMIADGAIEGVDEIYGAHLWNYQPSGMVGIQSGAVLAAADEFEIRITGVGGHGATPQSAVDPIQVGAQLVTALQTIVSRNTNPLESTVVSVCQFEAGTTFNIIPEGAILKGTARSYSEANRSMIKRRMQEIVAGLGQAFNARIELDYHDGYPPTINDENATEKARVASSKIAIEGVIKPFLTMGGEDFSYYAREIPGCFIFVGSAPPDRALESVSHHSPYFDIDESALLVAASIMVQLIDDQLLTAD
ncbi:MAG: amidohydrolase [Candidatus Neomarinimicrobiota bacterium]